MIYAIIAKLVRPLRMRHTVVLGDIEADISPLPHNSLISLNSHTPLHLCHHRTCEGRVAGPQTSCVRYHHSSNQAGAVVYRL